MTRPRYAVSAWRDGRWSARVIDTNVHGDRRAVNVTGSAPTFNQVGPAMAGVIAAHLDVERSTFDLDVTEVTDPRAIAELSQAVTVEHLHAAIRGVLVQHFDPVAGQFFHDRDNGRRPNVPMAELGRVFERLTGWTPGYRKGEPS